MLALSLLVLFVGPLLYQWLQRGGRAARALDRVIVVILVGVVFLLLVPESLEHLGWPALALIIAGYLVPGILERLIRRAALAFHMFSLVLALLGLILHAMLDGAGLAGSEHVVGPGLGLAIVLHRLGVGLIIWLLVLPIYGRMGALFVLLLVATATVGGYALSHLVLPLAGDESFHVVQALIIGMIVHSLVHRGHGERDQAHVH